jgi:hypothetical protein
VPAPIYFQPLTWRWRLHAQFLPLLLSLKLSAIPALWLWLVVVPLSIPLNVYGQCSGFPCRFDHEQR